MTHLSVISPPSSRWSDVAALRNFPILAETRNRVRKQMQSSQVNFDDLALVVEKDPALCLNLMVAAVSHNPGCREQISGAANCLSLLGMQELVRLIKHLPVVDANSESRQHQLYRRALHCADMAAEMAAHWAAIRGNISPDYARWNTLMVCAPLWQWLLSEELAQNWLYCLSEGQDVLAAINTCFGDNQLKNWQRQVKQLGLPPAALDCFRKEAGLTTEQWKLLRRHDPRDFDNQRQLLHRLQQPELIPMIATGLSWNWHIAPESNNARRWLVLASHWLGKPQTQVAADLRIIQLNASRRQNDALSSGLALLASPVATRQSYPKVIPAVVKKPETNDIEEDVIQKDAINIGKTTAEIEQITRQPDQSYLNKLLTQLQQQPDSFGDWHYLMRGVLRGVCQGLGMSSACIALLNKDKTALKVFYAENLPEQHPLRKMTIDLRQPSIFNKLLEKPASLSLTPENREKFLRHLPDATQQLLPNHWVTMSIDAGHKPIGLIMALNNDGAQPVEHSEYLAFKNLCLTASKSLAELRSHTAQQRPAASRS